WDYPSLTTKIANDMSAGRIVAWGCPEGPLRVRLTTNPLSAAVAKAAHAHCVATLVTTGSLCLVGYTSLTMCAQFADQMFPQPGDLVFTVAPGTYLVTIYRMFPQGEGHVLFEDQAGEVELPDGDHFIVVFAAAENTETIKHMTVPWKR